MALPAGEEKLGRVDATLLGSNALYAGFKTDVGTVAAPIGPDQPCSSVLVQADPNNTVDVFIGSNASQPIRLLPGMSVTIPCANVNLIYASTQSGTARVNWLALT